MNWVTVCMCVDVNATMADFKDKYITEGYNPNKVGHIGHIHQFV